MPPAKRKSFGGDSNKKGSKSIKAVTSCPATTAIVEWLQKNVLDAGGFEAYMDKTFDSEAKLMEFAQFIDETFPGEETRTYATEFKQGPSFLRPWMCGYRNDFGFSGTCEPDEYLGLAELIIQEGFRSDPDLGGVEKITICDPTANEGSMLETPYSQMDPFPDRRDLLPPFSVAFVKGWRRSTTLLAIMAAVKSLGMNKEDIPRQFIVSCKTIFATMGAYHSTREQIFANRGITLASVGTRKSPNAFTFLRQVEVLSRAGHGGATKQFEDWGNCTAVMRVFSIGKAEAGAVSNLQAHVERVIVCELKQCVAKRGIKNFLSHDILAKGVLNTGYTSASGNSEAWVSIMTNLEDASIVKLFLERLCGDWDKLPSNMRKSPSLREAVSLHQSCALFLHFLRTLEVSIPSSEFPAAKEKLSASFLLGVLDSDLITIGEKSVPPGDIKAIGAFRNILAARETQELQDREDQAKELAMKVAQATMAQIKSQFEGDMQKICAKLPTKDAQTVETAKDMKYIRDRQKRGNDFVKEWMHNHCKISLVSVKEDGDGASMGASLSEFSRYCADRVPPGLQSLVLCSVDATVWPSSTQYMMDCLGLMQNVCSLGPGNMAHIQQPLFHQATTMSALVKHRRRLEDFLLKSDLDISNNLTLTFSKDASMSSDKRAMTQPCYCVISSKNCRWLESEPLSTSVLGPLPRLRVSDMQGYDPETGSRPGAAARIEQKGIPCHRSILDGYLQGMTISEERDVVIFFDLCPNQFAEFSRACVERSLEGASPKVIYYGCFREGDVHKRMQRELESLVFKHWDDLSSSPPKQRPRSEAAADWNVEGLVLLSCTRSGPVWPEHLDSKFAANSSEAREIQELKQSFLSEFPATSEPGQASATGAGAGGPTLRATGQPDFSVDGGREPLDVSRVVDCLVEPPPAPADRLALVNGKSGKPSLLVDKHYKLWLGNESEEAQTWSGIELFGFNTGVFEYKIVRGSKRDTSGIAWKLSSDMDFVVQNKKILPVCKFLHQCAVTHGLGEVAIPEHTVSPKMHAAVNEQEAVPVAFRYNIHPIESNRTNVFRPNALSSEVKANSLGALWIGKWDQLPDSKTVDVLWEVELRGGQMAPLKPKMYLTATVIVQPGTWIQLP